MEAGDVSTAALRTRMALRAGAADFSVPRVVGSTLVVYVLWRKFFSAVMFTSKKATCIAPGCRSFARRCGHVRNARQAREVLDPEEGGAGMTIYVPGTAKVKRDKSARPRFVTSEEEDVGLEKLASDTRRAAKDSPEAELSHRRSRNLLACAGEMADGEAWNRTADWKALFHSGLRNHENHSEEDLKSMAALYESSLRRGLVKDTAMGLVEALCGSCGQRRGDQPVTFETVEVYTPHPTAPPLRVSWSTAVLGWGRIGDALVLLGCLGLHTARASTDLLIYTETGASCFFSWSDIATASSRSMGLPTGSVRGNCGVRRRRRWAVYV